MPFPLAHPAAILSLRRYCPQWLSFPALVIGSLSPDAGYLFGRFQLDELSHRWTGIIDFSLPTSLAALWLLYRYRAPILQRLPVAYRRLFSPACQRPPTALLTLVFSVIIGTASHLLWDSFTHKDGWFVEHSAILRYPVAMVGYRSVRVCHLLWYASTFGGVFWLGLVYQRWRDTRADLVDRTTPRVKWRNAVIAGLLISLLAVGHHLGHGSVASLLVAGGSFSVVIGFVMAVGKYRPRKRPQAG